MCSISFSGVVLAHDRLCFEDMIWFDLIWIIRDCVESEMETVLRLLVVVYGYLHAN